MSRVESMDFRRRLYDHLQSSIEKMERRVLDWPEREREAGLTVLAAIARDCPDLGGLAKRLDREIEKRQGAPAT